MGDEGSALPQLTRRARGASQGSLGAKSSSIVLANVNPDPKRYLDTMGTLLVASQLRTASRGGEGGPGGLTLSRAGTVEAVRRLETVEDIL